MDIHKTISFDSVDDMELINDLVKTKLVNKHFYVGLNPVNFVGIINDSVDSKTKNTLTSIVIRLLNILNTKINDIEEFDKFDIDAQKNKIIELINQFLDKNILEKKYFNSGKDNLNVSDAFSFFPKEDAGKVVDGIQDNVVHIF